MSFHNKTWTIGIWMFLLVAFISLIVITPSYAAISCTVTNNTACAKTYVLYAQNDTGGWSNAHSQNVSVNSYAYGICCNADSDGQTVTTECSSTAPAFLKLFNITNSHVEIPSYSNYAYSACIGVTNRNVTCTNSTGSCSAGYSCIASIASSESAGSNLTNAHIDANCSSTYPVKICCGYSNRVPTLSNVQLVSTSGNNYSSDNLTLYFTQSDPDGDSLVNVTDWRVNGQSIAVLNMPFNTNISVNTTGAVKDYSTYENNGTLGGGTSAYMPTWTNNEKIGGGYTFDGIDDRIVIQENTPLNFTQNLSYGAWFKANSLSNWAGIMSREPSWGNGYNLQIGTTQKIACGIGVYTNSNSAPTTDVWYHAVCVYNGTAMKLYVDGVLQNDVDTFTLNVGTGNLMLGVFYNSPSLFFNGSIDEVQIFNRSLSPEQIQAIYQAGLNNHSVDIIISNETAVGQNWSSCVTASDGVNDSNTACSNNLTIQSAVPTVTSAIIYPQPAYVNESLRGYCNATDADDATLYYHYSWFLNGVANATGTVGPYSQSVQINVANVSNNSLIIGQNWILQCIADDLTSNSTGLNSSITTILARTPEKVTLKNPTNGNVTVHDRQPVLEWYATNVTTYYEVNVTSNNCPTVLGNVTSPQVNFTPSSELCLKSEGYNTYYNWTVRACGPDACGNWSNSWNFTIEPYVDLTLVVNSINFSTLALNQEKDTSSGTPSPFIIRNDGNVFADLVNISVNQSMWQSVSLNTEYFQAKANISEANSFNTSGSLMNYFNLTSSNVSIVKQLNYSDASDQAAVDIKIKVPSAEPAGIKTAQLLFSWVQTP